MFVLGSTFATSAFPMLCGVLEMLGLDVVRIDGGRKPPWEPRNSSCCQFSHNHRNSLGHSSS